MAGKQTGPVMRVKVARLTLVLLAATLTGCAGTGWNNPQRNAAEQRADRRGCERDAEADTLSARGTSRGAYGADNAPSSPMPGRDARGPNPLEFHDKSELSVNYDKSFARCMRAKGYVQGHPADRG
jgi:hypothetical protein